MVDTIASFSENYRFLSNFHPSQVRFDGAWYSTVENAYQASKTLDTNLRIPFYCAPGISAATAKRMGKKLILRPHWKDVKLAIMENLLRQKFLHRDLLEGLLRTEKAELIEGNYWHDQEWGSCYCNVHKDIPGQNQLGILLMKIRAEMQGFKMCFELGE